MSDDLKDDLDRYNAKWAAREPGPARKIIFSRDRSMVFIGMTPNGHLIACEPSMPFEYVSNMDAAFDEFVAAGEPDYFEWQPSP